MLTQSKTLSIKAHLVRHFKCLPPHKQVNMNAENILHRVKTVAIHKHEFGVLVLLLLLLAAVMWLHLKTAKFCLKIISMRLFSEMLLLWLVLNLGDVMRIK